MVGIPQAQILDVVGPLEVFSSANPCLQRMGRHAATPYRVDLVTQAGADVDTTSGISLRAHGALRDLRGPIDTLLVPGGEGVREAVLDRELTGWIARASKRCRRVASVCTGAYLLAEAGLLEGKRATTHWHACEDLARRYPQVDVDPDPIWVKDGEVYTAAGVTSGMDLALALVEEDHGRDVALTLARWMVLFLKRPGGQSQFSAELQSQLSEHEPLRELQAWILENLPHDLSVPTLARRVGMSPRNFARVFAREVGRTPARFVEHARVEAARRRLEDSGESVEQVAEGVGFGSAECMRRAFLRHVRVSPADYRNRFARIAV